MEILAWHPRQQESQRLVRLLDVHFGNTSSYRSHPYSNCPGPVRTIFPKWHLQGGCLECGALWMRKHEGPISRESKGWATGRAI